MSSLGLTRTGRAPFLSLLNPSYMMSAACCCPTCPRLSFPSRNELPITSDDAGGIPSSASPPANDTVLKERRQIQPSQPHPDPPLTPVSNNWQLLPNRTIDAINQTVTATTTHSTEFALLADTIAPVSTAVQSPASNRSGWSNTDVTATMSASDQPLLGSLGLDHSEYA